ncbi:MAG: glycosyltransferase N-terminal domain-containing protein [Acidiferrobacterales bacterium]
MSHYTDRAYGSDSLSLLWHGMRDRLRGEHARANARWGHLRPPEGLGRLVWVEAGGEEGSVQLALGALRALRESRLDIRLVLTFEHEYPQILERGLAGLASTGFGYGPCDAPRAVRRTLRSFEPLGVIMARRAPAPNLCAALASAGTHCIALHTPAPACGRFEAAYPADAAQQSGWQQSGLADYIAPQADLATLLIEAQVDPNFRQVLCGSSAQVIWWILGADTNEVRALDAWWTASGLKARGILLVSPAGPETISPRTWLPISSWQRAPLASGSVMFVDESRWLPAIAATSDAAHAFDCSAWPFWQALAGGCPLSIADRALAPGRIGALTGAQAEKLFAQPHGFAGLEEFWQAMLADPIAARSRGDALRRVFWNERRRAGEVNQELLQRVFKW